MDFIELAGVALAVLVVTWLTAYPGSGSAPVARVTDILVNFAVALPLLGIGVLPLHVRRLRRGLRHQLEQGSR